MQGGQKAAASAARSACLSLQALETVAEMRGQFASMIADSGFVQAPQSHGLKHPAWIDDPRAAWNVNAGRAAVVHSCTPVAA